MANAVKRNQYNIYITPPGIVDYPLEIEHPPYEDLAPLH